MPRRPATTYHEGMRAALATLGLLLLAGGMVYALRPDAPEPPDLGTEPTSRRSATTEPDEVIVRREVGTMIVRVANEAGEVPPGTEVGYEALQRQVWVRPEPDGTRVFTNVPIGIVYVQARAPGHIALRQRRDLPPGVADEALLVLRRAETGEPSER